MGTDYYNNVTIVYIGEVLHKLSTTTAGQWF